MAKELETAHEGQSLLVVLFVVSVGLLIDGTDLLERRERETERQRQRETQKHRERRNRDRQTEKEGQVER